LPQAEEAFDVSAASEGGPAVEGRRRMAAVAAAAEEAAVSELQTTVNALQRGRIDDARRANKVYLTSTDSHTFHTLTSHLSRVNGGCSRARTYRLCCIAGITSSVHRRCVFAVSVRHARMSAKRCRSVGITPADHLLSLVYVSMIDLLSRFLCST
jgi:hypothetical protein